VTKQEIFNKVWLGLNGQNWKRSVDNKTECCVYRGPGGLKCAVGHLISDENYDPKMEGSCVTNMLEHYPFALGEEFSNPDADIYEFLDALQDAHDVSRVSTLGIESEDLQFGDDMKAAFIKFADIHNLEIP
jgi:hypothetical protein